MTDGLQSLLPPHVIQENSAQFTCKLHNLLTIEEVGILEHNKS